MMVLDWSLDDQANHNSIINPTHTIFAVIMTWIAHTGAISVTMDCDQ